MTEKKLGQYELIKTLGRGGMSTVYLAYDPNLEREVALKALPTYFAHDPEFSARFEREAKTISSLEHSAIVPIYDYGEEEGVPYLIMRLMVGGSLGDRLKKGPISISEAAKILTRIGSALDKANSRGILHRDIKPDNILFDEDGAAFLADFGIVKLASSSTTFTQTGSTLGTPAYMSPEQARGKDDLDHRSDIYSLGVVLYEMLTGDIPYEADTAMGQAMMHVLEPLPRILEVNPDLPEDAQAIIDKAMAKDREERYDSATELAEAVGALARKSPAAAPEPGAAEPVKEAETELVVEEPAPTPIEMAPEPEPDPVVTTELPPEPVAEPEPLPVEEIKAPVEPEPSLEEVAAPVQPEPEPAISEPAAVVPEKAPPERAPTPGFLSGLPPWVPFVVGGVVLLAIVGVFLMRGSGGGDPTATPLPPEPEATAVAEIVDPTATLAPTETQVPPTATQVPPTATVTPTPSKTPRPTATPTETVPPGEYVRINNISILNNNYAVFYETFEYTEALPGTHIHFYYDTVEEANAGSPGAGPWVVYGGPRPFTQYSPVNRSAGAEQICARVANPNHTINPGSGNCFDLPESADENAINLLLDYAVDWQYDPQSIEIFEGEMTFSMGETDTETITRLSAVLPGSLGDGIYKAKAVVESLGEDLDLAEASRSETGIELVLLRGSTQEIYLDYRLDALAYSGYCTDATDASCTELSGDEVDPLGDGDVVELEIDVLDGNAEFYVNGTQLSSDDVGFSTAGLTGVQLAIVSDLPGTVITFYEVLFFPTP